MIIYYEKDGQEIEIESDFVILEIGNKSIQISEIGGKFEVWTKIDINRIALELIGNNSFFVDIKPMLDP